MSAYHSRQQLQSLAQFPVEPITKYYSEAQPLGDDGLNTLEFMRAAVEDIWSKKEAEELELAIMGTQGTLKSLQDAKCRVTCQNKAEIRRFSEKIEEMKLMHGVQATIDHTFLHSLKTFVAETVCRLTHFLIAAHQPPGRSKRTDTDRPSRRFLLAMWIFG